MRFSAIDWSVYLITDRAAASGRSMVDLVAAAVRGGVTAVQLRDKDVPLRETLALGHALLAVTRPAGVPLLVNDRVDVALALDAEGVHVGLDDLPPAEVRRLVGPDRIVGFSASTLDEACLGIREGADYLGVGDVFGTPTKSGVGAPIGLDGLSAIVRQVEVPVVAIGGVTAGNAARTSEAGAAGVSVISAVFGAPDPETAARALRQAVEHGRAARAGAEHGSDRTV